MLKRRDVVVTAGLAALAGAASRVGEAKAQQPAPAPPGRVGYTPITTLGGATLPYVMKDGVKEFHLVAEPVTHEFAPGMVVKCWGYNGRTPGPTIEAVEGDRVRLIVTNKLREHTTIHWHGLFLPSGMDGVGGLTQPQIKPGETYVYEFTLINSGTFMYHPHADEMVQMAVGMMGMFIVHPKRSRRVDRDFAIMLHEWAIEPGTYRPDPNVMLDFNIFTMNSKVFPAIPPFVVKTGDRVRVRFGNLSMNQHPMHLHGYAFHTTATDGGQIPKAGQWPQTTVPVPVGSTRDVEFTADVPGDWAFHCHKSHHTMGAMGHHVPNTLGADQREAEKRVRKVLPGYMAMGETGMAEHQVHTDMGHMKGPKNTLPMMMGKGPFGNIEMGGMFSVLKVRDGITSYADPGWYRHPPATLAYKLGDK
jgi:FtsP/CotA-like multicopper oxidase with cupredoxin domain